MRIALPLVLFLQIIFLFSCKPEIAQVEIDVIDENGLIKLNSWNILGAIKFTDTTSNEFLDKDHLISSGISEKSFCKNPYKNNIAINKDFELKNGFKFAFYKTDEPIVDFNVICPGSESDLVKKKGSAVYYYSQLNTTYKKTVYLLTRSSNGIKVWLNGDSIYCSNEPKGFELTFSEFIPLKLKQGKNMLVIKRVNHSNDMLFEGIICGKEKAIQEYQKKTTLFILKNPIVKDTLWLLSSHAKDMDTNINYKISDLNGKELMIFSKDTSSNNYIFNHALKDQQAYVCSFTLSNYTFEQPFYVGDPDIALKIFTNKLKVFSGNSHDTIEISSYLYRLKFLLGHSSRLDDWWWKYKVSSIICELYNIFNNKEKGRDFYSGSFGLRFGTYQSIVDRDFQRYFLISPDKITGKEPLPLVVVIRPHISNYHHFLSSPQLARYWSLANAKYLANKYRFYILMPEAKMYLDEPMSPLIESEILQSINDVKNKYSIDNNRIYLQGNCSAGYRCLTLACHYPDVFAAIGMYAPLYHINPRNDWEEKNAPEKNLTSLITIPMAIHYDPLDIHSPYSFFEKLISDCEKNNIPLEVTSSKYSGLHYNVLLVGDEIFSFFKGKKKFKN